MILHLGSLRVGPSFNARGFAKHIGTALGESGTGPADYLAICGDLTERGQPEDFARLEEVLSNLVATAVRAPANSTQAFERVMVVPGPADVALGDGPFAAFSEQVLSTPVRSDGTVVRHLKDLSLVGVRYWNDGKRVNRDLLRTAMISLDDVLRQPELGVDYIKNTPTVLLSADSPFCAENVPQSEFADELRAIARPGFDLSMHLIGGGSCQLWRQAFTHHRHFTVAAGSAASATGGVPITMNTVMIGDIVRPGGGARRTVRIRAIRCQSDDDCRQDDLVDGQVTGPSYDGQGHHLVFGALRGELEAKLRADQSNCVVITGFPGAGKTSFADYLVGTTSFNGFTVQGYRFKLVSWNKEKVEKFFGDLVEKIRASCSDRLDGPWRRPIPLVVIEARPLPTTTLNGTTNNALFEVIAEFFAKINECSAYVTLFLPDPDRRIGDVPVWRLRCITDEEYSAFVATRSADIPLSPMEAANLTGRWAGFTDLLVDQARGTWDRYRGSAPVNAQTADGLIEDALGSDEAHRKADRFLEHFRQAGACQPVLDHVGAEVVRAREEGRRVVQFSQRSLDEALGPQRQPAIVIRGALKSLVRDGILVERPPCDYEVAVPFPFLAVPFLVRAVNISVFISYNTADTLHQAKAIAAGLQERAKPGVALRPYFHPEDGPDYTQEWRSKLLERVRNSRNLIFLHNGKPHFATDVVAGEVEAWLRYWRFGGEDRGRSGAIWVSFNGDTFPLVLNAEDFPKNYTDGIDRCFQWNQVNDEFLDHLYKNLVADPVVDPPAAASA